MTHVWPDKMLCWSGMEGPKEHTMLGKHSYVCTILFMVGLNLYLVAGLCFYTILPLGLGIPRLGNIYIYFLADIWYGRLLACVLLSF